MRELIRGTRRFIAGLKPVKVPDAPARSFRDLWPGDAGRGARLLRAEFEVLGTTRRLEPGGDGWDDTAGPVTWRAAAHGFAWLRDLRALGTDTARMRARDLAEDWLVARRGRDPGAGAGSRRRPGFRLARPLGFPRRHRRGRLPQEAAGARSPRMPAAWSAACRPRPCIAARW